MGQNCSDLVILYIVHALKTNFYDAIIIILKTKQMKTIRNKNKTKRK